MLEQNYLEISREDLDHNAKVVAEHVKVPVIGVVKCDGYGISLREAALAWEKAGARMLAVSTPAEAVELRQLGFRQDILLLCPVADPAILNTLVSNEIILTVTGFENARFYILNCEKGPLRVHVAVDTGMGRFGIRWNDSQQLQAVYSLLGLKIEGIFSHFACSFEPVFSQTRQQLDRFLTATEGLNQAGFTVGMRHIANSCAALRFPETRLDAVRIGSALVGLLPVPVPVDLRQAVSFQAQVIDRKLLEPGETTGYASICRIRRRTDAIIVAVGNDDGLGYTFAPERLRFRDLICYLFRLLRNYMQKPYVTYHGKNLPVIGRLGRQYSLFDATGIEIHPGSYVSIKVPLLFPRKSRKFI